MSGEPREIELTILMPCLNEAETVGYCIEQACEFLARSGIAGEIVIADNGSIDGSQAIGQALGARVVQVPTRGYGAALLAGIEAASGRYVIMGDSDASYDFAALDLFVAQLRAGWQLVMGNRFKGGILPGAMPPLHRYLGNPVLTATGRLLYGSPCGDFHCGLRGFDRQAIHGLALRLRGMEFASEMVVKATLQKLRITEVPTILSKAGRTRPPHLRSWPDGWRHLRFLLLLSPRWMFLYSGMAASVIGLVAVTLILPGPVSVLGVVLDIHTLLYASMLVVLGYQSMLFWVFCQTLNVSLGILPPDPWFDRIDRALSLERALCFAAALMVIGLALASAAALGWSHTGFGNLSPSHTMRFAIPSAACLLLATSTGSMAFILGFLRLVRM